MRNQITGVLLLIGEVLTIVWRGQAFMHSPHDVHFSCSMCARNEAIAGASFGHTFLHFVHPMHATPHSFMATGPRSRLAQATHTIGRPSLYGTSSQRFRGHASTHLPHPVHLLRSMCGRVSPGSICIAPKGHAATQSPHPRQP